MRERIKEFQTNPCKVFLNEKIIWIQKNHDEFFLASNYKGTIFQILIIKERNIINIIQNTFVHVEIKFLSFKNMKNIFLMLRIKLAFWIILKLILKIIVNWMIVNYLKWLNKNSYQN